MITKKVFGNCSAGTVYAYTLTNAQGATATILNLGGILQSFSLRGVDVVLGYDTPEEYLQNTIYRLL